MLAWAMHGCAGGWPYPVRMSRVMMVALPRRGLAEAGGCDTHQIARSPDCDTRQLRQDKKKIRICVPFSFPRLPCFPLSSPLFLLSPFLPFSSSVVAVLPLSAFSSTFLPFSFPFFPFPLPFLSFLSSRFFLSVVRCCWLLVACGVRCLTVCFSLFCSVVCRDWRASTIIKKSLR